MAPRAWGWWTRHKLEILENYLQAFVKASSKLEERVYLDLFAGAPENHERGSDTEILGSVHRALGVKPPFTRVCLFELESTATELEAAVRERYPDRPEVRVFAGDCNRTLARAAAHLTPVRWAPMFAFVDQYALEVRWSTLEQLSRLRWAKYPKTEMWILFGTSFYLRGLRATKPLMDSRFGDRMTAMFGCEDWVPIVRARRDGRLAPAETRDELLNLMRWRLENELGYRSSYPFVMKNTSGHDLYHMIFTSDHSAGVRIMRDLYTRAQHENEALRLAEQFKRRDRRTAAKSGKAPLFTMEPEHFHRSTTAEAPAYSTEPPLPPYGQR